MQKSRQVSLTPTRQDFNLHLNFIFFVVIEIVTKNQNPNSERHLLSSLTWILFNLH